jgi:transcriptional regulator with XRE-family HTH domain
VSPVNVGSIGEYIRQQREQAKISLRQLSSAAGVSNPYLSQIERGLRRPSAEILQQIAKGLRISAEALYVQAGILEDRRPDSGVRAAVLADPELTERQKQVLLDIYESFRRELAASAAEDAESATDAEPAGIEPVGIEPAAIESGGIEPGGIEPGGIEPAAIESGGIEPGGIEPGGIEPGGIEPGGIEPGEPSPNGGASQADGIAPDVASLRRDANSVPE